MDCGGWLFGAAPRGTTTLTQRIILSGSNAAAYRDQVETGFGSTLADGMKRIAREMVAAERKHEQTECVFCRILEGSLPSWRVYEDENSVAFLDKGQVTRGHTLVIPRRHAEDIWALSEDEARAVMQSVHRVARLLRDQLGLVGLNVTQANGKAAWQEVFHYHVHLIPRYGDDGMRPPWRSTSPSQEQLREVQRQIVQK